MPGHRQRQQMKAATRSSDAVPQREREVPDTSELTQTIRRTCHEGTHRPIDRPHARCHLAVAIEPTADIPNTFFNRVVPQERLTVVKVVGTVLRHTVGYQNQFGGRRSQAPLAYSYMQRWANIRDRSSLSEAIKLAIADGYLRRVSQGVVNAKSALRQPATYAVNWRPVAETKTIGSKTRPASVQKPDQRIGSKTRPKKRQIRKTLTNNRPRTLLLLWRIWKDFDC